MRFHPELDTHLFDVIVQKGVDPTVDSYSGFKDNGGLNETLLNEILKDEEIEEVYVVGLATDYCVGFTAHDAMAEGFKTFVVSDATKGVAPDTTKTMLDSFGDNTILSTEILG
mgnify:CR=1 FL=1